MRLGESPGAGRIVRAARPAELELIVVASFPGKPSFAEELETPWPSRRVALTLRL
jgi:hypothetical protein